MPAQKILQKTSFNFKLTDEKGEKGYTWCQNLHMSFQNKDGNHTLQEIINIIKVNSYNIKMTIKLSEGYIIHFDI